MQSWSVWSIFRCSASCQLLWQRVQPSYAIKEFFFFSNFKNKTLFQVCWRYKTTPAFKSVSLFLINLGKKLKKQKHLNIFFVSFYLYFMNNPKNSFKLSNTFRGLGVAWPRNRTPTSRAPSTSAVPLMKTAAAGRKKASRIPDNNWRAAPDRCPVSCWDWQRCCSACSHRSTHTCSCRQTHLRGSFTSHPYTGNLYLR